MSRRHTEAMPDGPAGVAAFPHSGPSGFAALLPRLAASPGRPFRALCEDVRPGVRGAGVPVSA
ncbi:hypothetical protein ACIBSR_13210 [Streptomyces sp. NPDC049936]|uniref:hypothetical protein n=1 Tax=Streptomyces sp. NPDC049936 TaxID=3365599 RepID=UPI00379F9132